MMRIRIIPILLLHNNGLVKSVRFKKYHYVGDPINAVKIFNEKEVDEIIVLDIDATAQKRPPNFGAIEEICGEAFMPMAYGGGITTVEQAQKILYNGAEKVIVNTALLTNPKLIETIAKQFGNQSVVASIDYKKTIFGKLKVFAQNGKQKTNWSPLDLAKRAEELGVGEVMLNSIDRDGTYKGYDLVTLEEISSDLSIPVIACGGASSTTDFEQAINHGASALAAGSMFVFQRPNQAVLISYLSSSEINSLNESLQRSRT